MRKKLIDYIDAQFAHLPKKTQMRELHDEILQNTLDRYDEEIAAGAEEEAAYRTAVGSIGDLDELLEPRAPSKGKKTVRKVILCSVIVLLLAGLLFCALCFTGHFPTSFFRNDRYGNTPYSIGSADGENVLSDPVDALDVQWPSGSISVSVYDGDTVILRETSQTDADDRLRYCVENGTLHVRFCESSLWGASFGKELEILLPAEQAQRLSHISLDLASAEAQLASLRAAVLNIDTASGDVAMTDCVFTKTEYDSASGVCRAVRCVIQDFEMDSSSGDAVLQGSINDISFDSASGSLTVVSDIAPKEIETDTASGDVDITIPADADFRLEFDSASGVLTVSGFSGTSTKDSYLCGSGLAEYSFDSASGDVIFRAN